MSVLAQGAPRLFAENSQGISAAGDCFHCGLPLPKQRYTAMIDGVARETCCAGCQSVAQLIGAQGLGSYYRMRESLPAAPDPAAGELQRYAHYDAPQVQAAYVLRVSEHEHETALLLEGVNCAACLWLIEQRLLRAPGIVAATVNHATRRLRVRWDPACTPLSAILAAIAALGYRAHPYDSRRAEDVLRNERRALLWRWFVAAFGMMQVMMYAFPAYISEGELPADIERLMQWAGLVLTLPVMLLSATPFFEGAWRGMRARTLNMDVPVSLGLATAFAASVHGMANGGAVYFDSICMFVFLLLGVRYLELNARAQAAREQDRLARLAPVLATRVTHYPDTHVVEEVPAALLRTGDVVRIAPGAAVPGDGVVIEGQSEVNEALLTGEARPILKSCGERVIAGAVNGDGSLLVRLTHLGPQTVVAGIVRLMDRALAEKPHLASLADAVASWFVLALLLVTAITAVIWWWIAPHRVLEISIALLVVTCPCALSLATPAALVAATNRLSRRGVLATRGAALETLARATDFVFDKTGTLTRGQMSLIGVLPLGKGGAADIEQAKAWVAALEASSAHPIGRALAACTPTALRASAIKFYTGQGVEGVVDGATLRAGTPEFVAALNGLALPPELVFIGDEMSVVALGSERGWIALFTLGDNVRPDARRVVHSLAGTGVRVHVLSGDRDACVTRVARRLGIVHAQGAATPADKVDYVRRLQRQGAIVAVVGDGVNDAPVLAQAQVSVAMASGTELARLSADVALLTDSLEPLLEAVDVARRTLRVVRQNFAWTFGYNLIAVPLAAMGHVTPWLAALGMSLSSLIVIGNALRLRGRA